MSVRELITEHLELWMGSVTQKSTRGRGNNGKIELTGIKKLRELILELAVSGKLVEQDLADEPANTLMNRITQERVRLLTEGAIKKPKKLKNTRDNGGEPFDIPASWQWSPLDDLAPTPLFDGDWIESKDQDPSGDIRLLQLADIGVGTFKNSSSKYINSETFQRLSCSKVIPGDILIARLPNPIGRAIIFPGLKQECITAVDVAILRTDGMLDKSYLVYALNSAPSLKQVESYGKGATRFRISTGHLKTILIPVPPLAEQRRIVQKVDELMVLCDRLEQQSSDQLKAHETLVDTLLGTLIQSENAAELADTWARLATHFDTLFTTEQSIDKLKQTILQLAVMGRLVEQDAAIESAALLSAIYQRKLALAHHKKIKKPRPLVPLTDSKNTYLAPSSWTWASFQDVADEISTGPFGSMIHKHDYVENGTPLINPSHMVNGTIKEDRSISVTESKADDLASYRLAEGDIVMARRGEVGRCAIVANREAGWLCGTGSFVLRFNPEVNRRFILLLFATATVRSYLSGNSVGTTMTNLNHGILNRMPVALPSASEQNRIVQKVDQLMTLCDQLKQRLNQASETRCQLANTVVAAALD